MNHFNLIKKGDDLYRVLRSIPIHCCISPENESELDKNKIGLWVDQDRGDHVIRQGNQILICDKVVEVESI